MELKIGDKINISFKDTGKTLLRAVEILDVEVWTDVPADDVEYGLHVYVNDPTRGKTVRFCEQEWTFELVEAAPIPVETISAEPAPRELNAFEKLLASAKFETVSPAADERAAFALQADAHYASLHLKSENRDWQQAAYAALSHHTITLTEIYAAIRAFDGSSREGDAAVLLESGLAEMHIVNGDKKFLLTERGYMVVWARGVSYFPNAIMAGLDTFMSVTEIATANKMTRRYINAEIERGNLVAQKIGNSYAIRREDYQKWLNNPRRSSRQNTGVFDK